MLDYQEPDTIGCSRSNRGWDDQNRDEVHVALTFEASGIRVWDGRMEPCGE